MKKKIIFFLHNFIVGGAETNLINYANYLINLNIDVYIVVISNDGILKKNVHKKVKIINLKKKRLLFSLYPVIKTVQSIKPDFLFSSLIHISLLLSFLKKTKIIKTKLFIRPSNVIFIKSNSFFNIKNFFINLLAKFFLRYGDLFFSISDEITKELKLLKIKKRKIINLDNAIIDKDFFKKSNVPLQLKVLKKHDYILSIGRLVEQKNHLMLIKAFSLIKQKFNKKIMLVIIGEGPLENKLRGEIEKRDLDKSVLIVKNMLNVKNYINNSKIFVQTSLWEGQPNVLIEAIILNKQVIATKCPGQNFNNLSKFNNFYILKENSVKLLSKAILYYLKKKKIFKNSTKKFHKYKIESSVNKIFHEIKKN
jgi:glycosyltransferase involved in cell wall biosynthesis